MTDHGWLIQKLKFTGTKERRYQMYQALKLTPVIAVLLLAACGGGGSDMPEPVTPPPIITTPPPAQESAQVELIAGSVPYDPHDICVDGAALGSKMGVGSAFARADNGDLIIGDWGICDSSIRIRAINFANNTIKTLAVGISSQQWTSGKEPLTTFMTPRSLAAAPSGDIYIGDSDVFTGGLTVSSRELPGRGPGIWKLDAKGNLSVLAGVSLPMAWTTVDGTGAAAAFTYIEKMCYGSDGLLYVNDYDQLRTVSQGGTVKTVRHGEESRQTLVACGIDGSVLARRWFSDSTKDDFYDPIAQKPIAKILDWNAGNNLTFRSLLYFGPDNPAVLTRDGDPLSRLTIVNLADGRSETVARFSTLNTPADLAATPPVIDAAGAAVATSSTTFDLAAGSGVLRFTRQP